MLKPLTQKIFLQITPPDERNNLADKDRIVNWLKDKYHLKVLFPYQLLHKIYPLCRESNWEITVTLCYVGDNWQLLNLEKGDTSNKHYGVAVDVGSTTIVMQLIDLTTGIVLAEESTFNKQIEYGQDILTRIFYAQSKGNQLLELQTALLATLRELLLILQKTAQVNQEDISIAVLAGNTTMMHFLLALNPWTVFHYPFAPIINEIGFLPASNFSLPLNQQALLYCFPSVGNYLGGDIISGLLVTDMLNREDVCIFIDIGTNGEIVIGNKDWLLAGAGAAGPALEGGVMKTGMRAAQGAVEKVKIDKKNLQLQVIGNTKPKGICGSGIVDMLAQLFLNGYLDFSGHLLQKNWDRIKLQKKELVFIYAWPHESATNKELIISQTDINMFLDTKAAGHTLVSYLLHQVGIDLSQIDKFYTAGAFGKYLDLESAITIGLYPDLPREKFISLGNSSLSGSKILLLNREKLTEVQKLKEKITYLELGAASDYLTFMYAARFLPHTNLDFYPTIKKQLEQKLLLLN